ncbi:MAG: ROK family protein [Candidatus Saccharibacteria bacterium]
MNLMYLAIDIGGTKTLLACFDERGQVVKTQKFSTPPDYKEFMTELKKNYLALGIETPSNSVVAVPGRIDRVNGEALGYGNLLWKPSPIRQDLETTLGFPVSIENDAKLAGLSEAKLIINEFKKVLYITISTGIGNALIINGVIDPYLSNSEGGQILVQDGGQLKQWEDVASGRAIVEKYGKTASELDDPQAWREISDKLAIGIFDLITVIQPEVIVFGGGVGSHFNKFQKLLTDRLNELANDLTPIPPLRQAKRAEMAVIYGCYDLIEQQYGQTA